MTQVNCAGCSECCRQQIVFLTPADAERRPFLQYDEATVGGATARALKNKPNGDCIHLGPNGCEVYEHRPEVCRAYDCRKQFLITPRNVRRRWANKQIWREARARLDTLDDADRASLAGYRLKGEFNPAVFVEHA